MNQILIGSRILPYLVSVPYLPMVILGVSNVNHEHY